MVMETSPNAMQCSFGYVICMVILSWSICCQKVDELCELVLFCDNQPRQVYINSTYVVWKISSSMWHSSLTTIDILRSLVLFSHV